MLSPTDLLHHHRWSQWQSSTRNTYSGWDCSGTAELLRTVKPRLKKVRDNKIQALLKNKDNSAQVQAAQMCCCLWRSSTQRCSCCGGGTSPISKSQIKKINVSVSFFFNAAALLAVNFFSLCEKMDVWRVKYVNCVTLESPEYWTSSWHTLAYQPSLMI